MEFLKKHYSNILFVLAIGLLLHPTSKAWILRQISFSPSVEAVEERVQLTNYNWQLKGVNTGDKDFNQSKGKVTIVNLWATWCGPCVAEMPTLEALYKDYGDKVDFILVTSEKEDKVLPFLDKHHFTLPIYNRVSQDPKEFYTETIPKTFLLDKKGNIVVKAGRADWNSEKTRKLLDQLLAE